MVTGNIFKVFGRSPIKPLQKHMRKALETAEKLPEFFTATTNADWEKAASIQQTIASLENDADQIKQDIRSHLPKKLFLPVPREDVLEILTVQDKLPNRVKDIAGLVVGRRMQIPTAILECFNTLVARSIECTRQAHVATSEIDELLETGFCDNEIDFIENVINKVCEIEHETDNLQIDVRAQLFHIENELSPIDVMFLYKVIEWTGDIADKAEQIAERLQLLIAR